MNAPTIYTWSPAGKSNSPINVVPVAIFKGDEDDALKLSQGWTAFTESYQIKSIEVPDLAALRKTVVYSNTFKNTMNQVTVLMSVALVLHTYVTNDKLFNELIVESERHYLKMALSANYYQLGSQLFQRIHTCLAPKFKHLSEKSMVICPIVGCLKGFISHSKTSTCGIGDDLTNTRRICLITLLETLEFVLPTV